MKLKRLRTESNGLGKPIITKAVTEGLGGWITRDEAIILSNDFATRLTWLYVRFHEGRIVIPAQDFEYFVGLLEKDDACGLRDIRIVTDGDDSCVESSTLLAPEGINA